MLGCVWRLCERVVVTGIETSYLFLNPGLSARVTVASFIFMPLPEHEGHLWEGMQPW